MFTRTVLTFVQQDCPTFVRRTFICSEGLSEHLFRMSFCQRFLKWTKRCNIYSLILKSQFQPHEKSFLLFKSFAESNFSLFLSFRGFYNHYIIYISKKDISLLRFGEFRVLNCIKGCRFIIQHLMCIKTQSCT